MSRDLYRFGECVVSLSGTPYSPVSPATYVELGLTSDQVQVTPQFYYQDIRADAFGPFVPPETFWMLGMCYIGMTLVDFDPAVLQQAIEASMGLVGVPAQTDGAMAEAGTSMGGGSGNYSKLYLISGDQLQNPYVFPFCHLMGPPHFIPLGVERSLVKLQWRSLPYKAVSQGNDLSSSSTVLWSRSAAAVL